MNHTKKNKNTQDRIEGNSIILNKKGEFPKNVVIKDYEIKEAEIYRLIKTKFERFHLSR